METQKTNHVEKKVFRCFMTIKNQIVMPLDPVEKMSDNQLITYLGKAIRDASDEAGIPLFRMGKLFWAYPEHEEPLLIPKNLSRNSF